MTCCACGTEFGEGQSFFSGLKDQGADLVRLDFCPRCWTERVPDGFFCFWRRRRPRADRKPVANTELILEFFDRLEGLEPDRPWLLVLGNEESGLRRLTLEKCDVVCRVPGRGPLPSLNVSVAAGIFIQKLAVQPANRRS